MDTKNILFAVAQEGGAASWRWPSAGQLSAFLSKLLSSAQTFSGIILRTLSQ